MISNAKRCTKCKEIKALGEFGKHKSRKDGLQVYCRPCTRAYSASYYSNNREKLQRIERRRKYGLSQDDFDEMLARQGNACELCETLKPSDYKWHVDHDHSCCPGKKTCGKCVRAILCNNCNSALGKFKDNPELLRQAAEYIESYRKAA